MVRRVPPPQPEYLKFLSPYGERITELALATRKLVLEEAPDAHELVYNVRYAVASWYSFTGRASDSFVHIVIYKNHVNLGFNHGVALEDPHRLLNGTGKWIRHVRVAEARDLKLRGVRELVQAAVAGADRPTEKPAGKKS